MSSYRRTTAVAQRVATAVVGVLVAVPLVLAALLVAAGPAEASTYRYWTYWWGANPGKAAQSWTFAQVGPAGHRVNDAWVLGWRFATSTTTTGSAPPRESSDFATLCPSLPASVAGHDRVALVVDYGTAADAPPGQTPPSTSTARVECLTLPSTPQHETGAQVLAAAGVTVRSENGLICGLDGYPVGECAPVIPDPVATTPAPTATAAAPAATAPSTSPTPGPRSSSRSPSSASATAPSRSSATTAAASSRPSSAPAATPSAAAASAAASTSTAVAVATTATAPSASAAAAPGTTPAPGESTLPAAAGAPAPAQQSSGSPVGLLVGVAVVSLVAGSAWVTSRRRGPG